MGLEYAQTGKEAAPRSKQTARSDVENAVPNSVRLAAQGGAADPGAGDGFDLAAAMRQRMESSFGSDLSYVKEYGSRSLGKTGPDPMSAGGDPVYGGAVAPLSAASAAPMAGPMQASRGGRASTRRAGPELIHEKPTWGDVHWDWKQRNKGESGRRNMAEIAPSAEELMMKRSMKNFAGDTRAWKNMGSLQDRARMEQLEAMSILEDEDDELD